METTTLIGIAIFAGALLIVTWQFGFAFGQDVGRERERRCADRRVQGVLASLDKVKPKPESTRKRLVYRKVDARKVGAKRYLNSRLPGEVLA